jgi:isopentenyl diphosphate isomerase/L-lactate dehydrogenase-like FMN-dependent dehydrogenase
VEDNASFADNRAAFREWGFVPRVLVNVRRAFRILSAEISTDMAMLGITSLEQLTPGHVRRVAARQES